MIETFSFCVILMSVFIAFLFLLFKRYFNETDFEEAYGKKALLLFKRNKNAKAKPVKGNKPKNKKKRNANGEGTKLENSDVGHAEDNLITVKAIKDAGKRTDETNKNTDKKHSHFANLKNYEISVADKTVQNLTKNQITMEAEGLDRTAINGKGNTKTMKRLKESGKRDNKTQMEIPNSRLSGQDSIVSNSPSANHGSGGSTNDKKEEIVQEKMSIEKKLDTLKQSDAKIAKFSVAALNTANGIISNDKNGRNENSIESHAKNSDALKQQSCFPGSSAHFRTNSASNRPADIAPVETAMKNIKESMKNRNKGHAKQLGSGTKEIEQKHFENNPVHKIPSANDRNVKEITKKLLLERLNNIVDLEPEYKSFCVNYIDELTSKLSQLEKHKKIIESKLSEKANQLMKNSKQHDDACSKYEGTIRQQREYLDEERKRCKIIGESINVRLTKAKEEAENSKRSFVQELQPLKAKLSSTMAENARLNQTVNRHLLDIQGRDLELKKLIHEINSIKQQYYDVQFEQDKMLATKAESLNTETEYILKNIHLIRSLCDRKDELLQSLSISNANCKSELTVLQDYRAKAENDCESLRAQINKYCETFSQLNERLDRQRIDLDTKNIELKKLNDELVCYRKGENGVKDGERKPSYNHEGDIMVLKLMNTDMITQNIDNGHLLKEMERKLEEQIKRNEDLRKANYDLVDICRTQEQTLLQRCQDLDNVHDSAVLRFCEDLVKDVNEILPKNLIHPVEPLCKSTNKYRNWLRELIAVMKNDDKWRDCNNGSCDQQRRVDSSSCSSLHNEHHNPRTYILNAISLLDLIESEFVRRENKFDEKIHSLETRLRKHNSVTIGTMSCSKCRRNVNFEKITWLENGKLVPTHKYSCYLGSDSNNASGFNESSLHTTTTDVVIGSTSVDRRSSGESWEVVS